MDTIMKYQRSYELCGSLKKGGKYDDKKAEFLNPAKASNDEEGDALAARDSFNNYLGGSRGFYVLRWILGSRLEKKFYQINIEKSNYG